MIARYHQHLHASRLYLRQFLCHELMRHFLAVISQVARHEQQLRAFL